MGQKVSPIGFRTGITRGWASRWFAPKSNFGEFLVEDWKIREFVENRMNRQPPYAGISRIEIERTREEVKVTLKTARPGLVIGPRGAEVEKLKEALEDLSDRRVNVNVLEITHPDLDAQLAAGAVAEQLKRRASFRRAIKQRCETIMQAGAKGVKIQVGGRLGGAEMSRTVKTIMGSIPLHTLDADVDYGFAECFATYGALGVKVWIYRGKFGADDHSEKISRPGPSQHSRPPRRQQSGGGRPGGGGGGQRPRATAAPVTEQKKAPGTPVPKQDTPAETTEEGK
jgi:small subunit ribosomal protein S3